MFTSHELITIEYALKYVIQDLEYDINAVKHGDWLTELKQVLYKIQYLLCAATAIPAAAVSVSPPRSDGLPHCQRSLYPGRHPRWQNLPPQRLGRATGRRDEPVPSWWQQPGQPPELFALVHPHHHGRHQMRGGQPRARGARTHGLAVRAQFRQRQRPSAGRSLPAARPALGLRHSAPHP